MRWQKKLTKKERKHLRETGARALGSVLANVEFQAKNSFPCWECVGGRCVGLIVVVIIWL